METLFITGAGPNGITGRLIKEHFEGKYNLLTQTVRNLILQMMMLLKNTSNCTI